ncbi:MAG TPA: hypothetical protein VMT16_01040, partial [Thermoanaerobaculia bacterium]|nr:hypothetical protein [Thermoanaerobaculia bacterium]
LALAALLLCAAAAHAEMTLDEVLAKHLEARGGKQSIQAVDSARITGSMSMGGMEVPVVFEWKRPDLVRMEFVVQGQTGIQAYDGETAWMYMPFMGKTEPEGMPEEQARDMKEQADFDGPLVDYQQKGHALELLGKEEVEGTDAYKLKLTKAGGDETIIYIDADHFLEIKSESKRKQGDQEMEIETASGNYKQVGELVLPHSLQSQAKGAPAGAPAQVITIEKYELGVDIAAERFAMPEKAPAAEPQQ